MNTKDYLARNIQMLMALNGWNKVTLAKRAGISDRMVAYLINKERAATIEVADAIGKAFGINGWLMISPHLTPESYKSMEKLNQDYASTTQQGREHIEMVADREAAYSKRTADE